MNPFEKRHRLLKLSRICACLIEAEVRSSVQNPIPCVKPRPDSEEVCMVLNGSATRGAFRMRFRFVRIGASTPLLRNNANFQPLPIFPCASKHVLERYFLRLSKYHLPKLSGRISFDLIDKLIILKKQQLGGDGNLLKTLFSIVAFSILRAMLAKPSSSSLFRMHYLFDHFRR